MAQEASKIGRRAGLPIARGSDGQALVTAGMTQEPFRIDGSFSSGQ